MNILQYGAVEERLFENLLSDNGTGYTRKTTFYSDLSIAEAYGVNAIKDTYNNVMKSWIDNVEYITEFCICLNYKSWEMSSVKWNPLNMSQERKTELCALYADLFYECRDKFYEHYADNEEATAYFYQVTD